MAILRISPARALRCLKLSKYVPYWDACKLTLFRYTADDVIRVRVRKWKRSVWLRPGTSDLQVFQKVVVDAEYAPPQTLQASGILDAGAYIGLSTLYLHHLFPNAAILAVEPDPQNFKLLEKNISGVDGIQLLNGALWSGSASCVFQADSLQPWASRVVNEPSEPGSQVRCIALNDVEGILGTPVEFIKMDIEGAEAAAFCDVSDRVAATLKAMVIEFHERFFLGSSDSAIAFACRYDHQRYEQGENTWFIFKSKPLK